MLINQIIQYLNILIKQYKKILSIYAQNIQFLSVFLVDMIFGKLSIFDIISAHFCRYSQKNADIR